jgi:hypothetical protein
MLYDEPSASLDPKAEHGALSRLFAKFDILIGIRSLRDSARVEGRKDPDIFYSQVWEPHPTCGSYLVIFRLVERQSLR